MGLKQISQTSIRKKWKQTIQIWTNGLVRLKRVSDVRFIDLKTEVAKSSGKKRYYSEKSMDI